ncbi:MAG: deoxyribonuclease V [Wenzhouxiangella sp.]|nr:deoxyribonuclease V [Wenzhouxiangella sp.]
MRSNAAALIARQRKLAGQVDNSDAQTRDPKTGAGIDVAFPERGQITRAAAVLLSFPELETIDQATAELPTTLPYIPGLLSFRELPAVLAALAQLTQQPDLVLCDGQGLAHPRRFGIACHLGVATGLVTIGVGKSRLCGQFAEPARERGASSPLLDGDEVIGSVLRTRAGVKPVFVSVGHRISLDRAVALVLRCTPRFRLPQPIRQADRLAGGKM